MLRKTLIVLAAASALAAPAMAEYGWTGFHAGINLGYTKGAFRLPFTGTITSGTNTYTANGKVSIDRSGFIGGGQFGYDYLFANGWLIGLETDGQATSADTTIRLSGPLNATTSYDLSLRENLAFLNTARARLGYLLPQNVLIYGTAGLAYGGVGTHFDMTSRNTTDNLQVEIDRFAVRTGWTVGGGVEYPVSERISLRGEYLFADLGRDTLLSGSFTTPPPYALSGSGDFKQSTRAHIVRVAINYAL